MSLTTLGFMWDGFWGGTSIEPTSADEPRLEAGRQLFGHTFGLAALAAVALLFAIVGLVRFRHAGWIASAIAIALVVVGLCTTVPSFRSEQAHLRCLEAHSTVC